MLWLSALRLLLWLRPPLLLLLLPLLVLLPWPLLLPLPLLLPSPRWLGVASRPGWRVLLVRCCGLPRSPFPVRRPPVHTGPMFLRVSFRSFF